MANNVNLQFVSEATAVESSAALVPGWRAAVNLLEQRRRVIADEHRRLAATPVANLCDLRRLSRQLTALDYAVGELRDTAKLLGLSI